jgi:hypothetical protein
MRQNFGFSSLATIDNGKIELAFNQLCKEVAKDLAERPHDKTARKVTVVIEFKPDPDEQGVGDRANFDVSLHANVPKRRTRTFAVGVKPSGAMLFNPDAPDDPHQGTLDEVERKSA